MLLYKYLYMKDDFQQDSEYQKMLQWQINAFKPIQTIIETKCTEIQSKKQANDKTSNTHIKSKTEIRNRIGVLEKVEGKTPLGRQN